MGSDPAADGAGLRIARAPESHRLLSVAGMQRLHELFDDRYALPQDLLERTLTPALTIFAPLVQENVRRMLTHLGSPERWRPHLKTTKTPEIWRELFAAGVRQFKCATTREARLCFELADELGVRADLLIAYPLVCENLAQAGRVALAHPSQRLSVLCEDPERIAAFPAELGVFVDVNPGMHRTGQPLDAREQILAVARRAGQRFRGIHFYEGHVHARELGARRRQSFGLYDRLLELLDVFRAQGLDVAEVITSGTPAVLDALAYEPLRAIEGCHRVSPGTVVLHDLRTFEEVPDLELVPAAIVLARVVSHPRSGRVTCDAGSKTVAAEAGNPCAIALGHPELVAQEPNEEHLPFEVESGQPGPARGALLRLVPRHICPTVNLAEAAWWVEANGSARAIPIRGRAHELVGS